MNDPNEVWVTGIGLITAAGSNAPAHHQNIFLDRHFLSQTEYINTIYADELLFGEIKLSNDFLSTHTQVVANRCSYLSILAIKETLQMSGEDSLNQCALVTSTSVGNMDVTEIDYVKMISGQLNPTKEYTQNLDAGSVTRTLQKYFGFGGLIANISTACSSSSNAIIYGTRLIRNGFTEKVICGGVDVLCKFTINGFKSLKNISAGVSRPFDNNRDGLNLGEGAAYLMLESKENAIKNGKKPVMKISGFSNFNEPFHSIGSRPDGHGAQMAMQGALMNSSLKNNDIDFIQAHGTATEDNDLAEGIAIKNLFGSKVPFSSIKSRIGHSLSASGAIGACLSAICFERNEFYSNYNFHQSMQETELMPLTQNTSKSNVKNIMVNSFGFGGNKTSLIFSKVLQ